MGMIDLVGLPLLREALMGIVFGDISPEVGGDSSHTVPLSWEMTLQSFFWHDCWYGDFPLKDLFPRLYVLAVDKNASVAEYWEQVYGNGVWAPILVRDGFVDDDSLVNFFNKLNEAKIEESSIDRVQWNLTTQRCFTIRSFYLRLLDGKFPP